MFKLHADKVRLDCTQKELVTSGSVGINECQFTFGPEWDEMDKVIVFRAGSVKVSIALDISNTCKIPWEVLEEKDQTLEVGVYGTRGGDVAQPTVWATLGTVREGATVGDTAQPPTPDIYETILEAASSAMRVAQSVRDDADSGAFDGEDGEAATIEVGETITGEPNTPAKVENIGTNNKVVLRFTLPGGLIGPTGKTPKISMEVTSLPAGSEPTVDVSGPPEAPVISLGIPAGQTGSIPNISAEVSSLPAESEPTVDVSGPPEAPVISLGIPAGRDGDDGQTPNLTIGTVETLPAGSNVTASITGETPNLVLNLGIPQGREGDIGKAATVTIGQTTTGQPGTPASVVNTGTDTAAVLRFTIPSGATGATPDISVDVSSLPAESEPTVEVSGTPEAPVIALGIPAGKDGDDGQTPNLTVGTVDTLPAGSSVTASITGETPNLVLNLGVPRGGDGAAATVTVGTTTTGEPGTQASVSNSGTPNAAVLNFTIPQGPAGEGVPSTDGVPQNYVLTPAGWAEPSGGSERAWTMLGETDCSVVSGNIIYDGLENFTEFLVRAETVKNESTSNSGYWLIINNKGIAQAVVSIKNQSLATEYFQWVYTKFNGLVWDVRSTAGATAETNLTMKNANANFAYNFVLDVGAATKFQLQAPVTQYQAVSGKITVWGR